MEVAAAATGGGIDNHETTAVPSCPQHNQRRSLNRKTSSSSSSSSSFRLRSPSLNTLRLRRIFDIFDKNGDGNITVKELYQALNLLGLEAELSELESTVASHVKPGSDGLQFEDFVSLHESLDDTFFDFEEDQMEKESADKNSNNNMSQEDRDLSEAFKVFDEDGDGFISAKELQVVLGKLGLSEGNEIGRVQQMIGSVDRNDDGRVDFFEFKNMMQSVVVRSS
ncbi:Calcium-binding protein [Melia azedarach]|uniref:Calcium-binding protein n=1 Tax=Melia azedarach TaxID=155640 RepID=A0ACC1WY94_MELAZ|nr:Calcium-binding protein [Melia azedarach]